MKPSTPASQFPRIIAVAALVLVFLALAWNNTRRSGFETQSSRGLAFSLQRGF